MDNALMVQVVLGLLVIFFFVTIGFSVRTWRFAHLFFLVLTFFAAGTFGVFGAIVLKTHKNWRTEVQKMEKDLEVQLKLKDDIQFGDVAKVEQEANLRSVKAEIARTLLDRGRVWRGCQPGNFDGMTVTVTTTPVGAPVAEGAAAPAAKPNNIEVKTILYAFKELPDANNTMFLPGVYLGEFVATAVTESSVTLAPTVPLDADQLQQIRVVDSSWVLYEVLPIDGHEFFAGLDDAALRALIPQGNLTQEAYDALIASYLRTGTPATDEDSLDSKWVKVKFLKKKTIDVDSEQMMAGALDFFDQQGRSVASRLRRNETVEFDLGDTAIVDQATAETWAAAGDVEKQEFIFMRPLNDYASLFRSFYNQRELITDKIERVTRETATVEAATMQAEMQLVALADEKTKIEQDKANFLLEQTAVTELETALKAQSEDLRKLLSQTYLTNQQLAAELRALQQRLADEITKADTTKTASTLSPFAPRK